MTLDKKNCWKIGSWLFSNFDQSSSDLWLSTTPAEFRPRDDNDIDDDDDDVGDDDVDADNDNDDDVDDDDDDDVFQSFIVVDPN